MTIAARNERASRKPLRLWPGVLAAVLFLLVRLAVPLVIPGTSGFGLMGGIVCALAIVVWWVFFSRAPWPERAGAIVLMAVALFATSRLVHESIANGMMGMMLPVFAIPVMSVALVFWAVASRPLSGGQRRASMVVAILLACSAFTLLRTGGISGDADSDLHWRWTRSPEERLLARAGDAAAAPAATESPATRETAVAPEKTPASPAGDGPAVRPTTSAVSTILKSEADWPGFRGRDRDGIIHGVRINTDWAASPPIKLWSREIGPGWSSFAVDGDFIYTQEQRGEDEIVASYRMTTGEPVWRHRDAARFWESNAGAGPRATPSLSNGRVYTFGATGIVNALDARDGAVIWSRNAAADTSAETPGWGFASSPLVVNDLVIVAASGRLVAYDAASGRPRWFGPPHGGGYSSPHLMTIGGVSQILLLTSAGVTSVAPADGTLLWEHQWSGMPILQPARMSDHDLLIPMGDMAGGAGTRRIAVAHSLGGWTVQERWTSTGLKPYFNDIVVHKGHAFGFDGSILACIDLDNGTRKWKGGRYGHGQLVLLPDQDLMVVLSEDGGLALVRATPDQFTEIARVGAIEGKTWNHPVLAGNVLLLRNGEEMAAFRLSVAGR